MAKAASRSKSSSTNWSNSKKSKKKKRSPPKEAGRGSSLTYVELVEGADHAVHCSDSDQAITLFTAALHKSGCIVDVKDDKSAAAAAEPTTYTLASNAADVDAIVSILEKRAEVYISIQNQNDALQDYRMALSILLKQQPDEQRQKAAGLYMYIGQLCAGNDALQEYTKGVEVLKQLLLKPKGDEVAMSTEDDDATSTLQQQLGAAYCCIAELYLTDLCYDENAEQLCEENLQHALLRDDTNMDALQTLTSLRLSQQRTSDAVTNILAVYEQIRVGCDALATLVGIRSNDGGTNDATELMNLQEVQELPSFEFRCTSAKLLLECCHPTSAAATTAERQQNHVLVQNAINVLGSLLAENDDVVEIWILLGDAYDILDQGSKEGTNDKQYYWSHAQHMLTSIHKSITNDMDMNDDGDDEMVQAQLDDITEQLEDIQSKLDECSSTEEEETTMEE